MAKKEKKDKKEEVKLVEVQFEGEKAKLLEEACKLTRKNSELQKKCSAELKPILDKYAKLQTTNQKRIDKIREELGTLKDGKYTDEDLNVLEVKTLISYSTPSPDDVKEWLKNKRMGKLFPTVIKVQMGPLRKIMSEVDILALKSVQETGKETKWTFR